LSRTSNRDRIFLATKGSGLPTNLAELRGQSTIDWSTVRFEGAGATTLRDDLESSLRRLGTNHVDLFYVHVDDRATPLEETLGALDSFVRDGKARHIGWSNVRAWRLERIRWLCQANGWTQPVALQQMRTYLRPPSTDGGTPVDSEQLDYLAERDDLTLFAYSPTFKGSYDSDDRWEHVRRAGWAEAANEARRQRAQKAAAELGCTANQLVIAWMMRQLRTSPIIGVRTWEQYVENVAAADIVIPDDLLAELDAA
jgi:aryl-alcohol dehydrogenase-like predicted oxidoreductase